MWAADTSEQGGGGFLDQTYNEQSTQPAKTDPIRGNAVVPLMIGHITNSTPDTLNLWKTPIKLVTLVAYVQKFERVTTKISYELVDETGTINAFQWLEDGRTKGPQTVPAGSYAKVVGSPREHAESRHIFILRIQPVVSMTDILEHLLEVTYICLRGKEILGPSQGQARKIEAEPEMDSCHGMNKEQALVFKVIKSENDTDSGIEKSNLKAKVPPSVRNSLDEILDFLVCEGHIYTTCTDDHFKTT